MLWRALKHVANGFYIDVGANDPDVESVTKVFYERGWHGINVEPLPSHHADLVRARVRDINVLAALGHSEGIIDLWECQIRGWATASPDVAARHEAAGYPGVLHQVQLTTLTSLCKKFSVNTVHFLKIDAEGLEKEVICGMDFTRYRPWILVVEATVPNSSEENYWAWEPIVLSARYTFAYSDGLNRFYVAEEHAAELLPSFKYPPNVFDGFKLIGQLQAESKAQQAESKAQQAESKAQQAEAKAQQAEAKAQQAEAASTNALMQLQAVYASTSWRITAPLRAVSSLVKKWSPKAFKSAVRECLKRAAKYVNSQPKLRKAALEILNRFPAVKYRLARIVNGVPQWPAVTPSVPVELAHLSPHARRVYADLKAALGRRRGERH